MKLFLRDLQKAVDGEIDWSTMPPRDRQNTALGPVRIDSREVQAGDVFWALQGTRQHGADFAQEAFIRGAVGVVSDRAVTPLPGCFCLRVPDTRLALWQLATWWRELFSGNVVAVTGSVGKTTTREMIHTVLGSSAIGSASPQNFNNEIGVPLSIVAAKPFDAYTVLELGASRRGEIDALARLAAPSIGVITRLADAHLGQFGGYDAIVAAKTELLAALPPDGVAILSGDDERLRRIAAATQLDVVTFGRSVDCDINATRVAYRDGLLRFHACGKNFSVPVWGRHHLDAALAAISVGRVMDYSAAEISEALSEFRSVPMRCELMRFNDVIVINDTYNSNPTAAKAALALLREFGTSSRHVVLTGDMLELGDAADRLHYQLGQKVVTSCGADVLVTCGDHAECVARGAREAGMPTANIITCKKPLDTVQPLRDVLLPGDVLLAKGSRAMQMEEVIAALADKSRLQAA